MFVIKVDATNSYTYQSARNAWSKAKSIDPQHKICHIFDLRKDKEITLAQLGHAVVEEQERIIKELKKLLFSVRDIENRLKKVEGKTPKLKK